MSNTLTIKQAAAFLEVSENTLRNWDTRGKLIARRHPINNYRVYSIEQLQEELSSDSIGNSNSISAPSRSAIRSFANILRDRDWTGDIIQRFDEFVKLAAVSNYISTKTGSEKLSALGKRKIDSILGELFCKYSESFQKLNISDEILQEVTHGFASMPLSGDLGLVFEELVKNTFDKGEHQQFFTPNEITEFLTNMVSTLLADKKSITLCDPAVGTGGFLIQANKIFDESGVYVSKFHGADIDERLAWGCHNNLVSHGIDSERIDILHLKPPGSFGDGLNHLNGQVDVILTNPPFGSEIKSPDVLSRYDLGREYSSRRRSVLFIERCLRLLKPGGIMGMVVEESILNSHSNQDVRRMITEHGIVRSIVKLPDSAFQPYATVSTSLMVFQKKESDTNDTPTFFAKVKEIGRRGNGEPDMKFDSQINKMVSRTEFPLVLDLWANFADNGANLSSEDPLCFICQIINNHDGSRFDTAFLNPARLEALEVIQASEFSSVPLSKLVTVRNQPAILSQEVHGEVVRFIGLGDIEPMTGNYLSRMVSPLSIKSTVRRFEGGDILYAKMRPNLRKVALIPDNDPGGFCSSECIVFSPVKSSEKSILPDLLAITLRSDICYGQIIHKVTGIGRPRVNKRNIFESIIPIPPLSRQNEILGSIRRKNDRIRAIRDEISAKRSEIEDIENNAMQDLLSGFI